MFYHVIAVPIQCSKCGGQNIAKPANDSQDWIYSCLDCGHTKEKEEPVTTTGSYIGKESNEPVEF